MLQALVTGIKLALGGSFFAKYSTDIASMMEWGSSNSGSCPRISWASKEDKSASKTIRKRSSLIYSQNIQSSSEYARFSKILTKQHWNPTFLKKWEGSWVKFSDVALELPPKKHLSSSEESYGLEPHLEVTQPLPNKVLEPVVSEVGKSLSSSSRHNASHDSEATKRLMLWFLWIYQRCISYRTPGDVGVWFSSWKRIGLSLCKST